jgi:alkanesulfonate monooxygenase SsuD/methylene tetrahydromethanopterin reductase-like flavin-dependent oxidoreductase (luciferase family)
MSGSLAFSIVTTSQAWLEEHLERIDRTGFEALYVVDHPAFAIPDPWTWLAWAAGRTERIRLGTHVTGAPFHHPTQLAKQVAGVDLLSHGRVTLGIGTGYEHQDFLPYGYPMPAFNERVGMLDETLRILRSLWTEEKTDFQGLHYTLSGGATFEPKPRQKPHPPIVVGLNRPGRLLRIAAEQADAINTWQLGPDQIAALRPHMDAACQRAGRPAGALRLTADVLFARDAATEQADALATAVREMARSWGRDESVTDWSASGVLHGDADAMAEQVMRFAEVGVCELGISFHSIDDVLWFDENVIENLRTQRA